MTHDPERLVDQDPNSDIGRALRAAQGDVLSEAAVSRLRTTLAAASVAGAAAGAAGGASLAKGIAGKSTLLGSLAKIGLAAAVVGGGAWALRDRFADAPPIATATIGASSEAFAMSRAAAFDGPPAPSSPAEPAVAAPPAAAAQPPALPRKTAEPAPAPPTPREGALLLEARRVLESDPAKALALVHTHEREFPVSQLAPERARIAAEAGARLQK